MPKALAGRIGVGSRVRIELHGRRVGAWVVEDEVTPPEGVVVKPLSLSSGEGPPPSVVALAEWASWRWAGPVSSFLGTASPTRVIRRPSTDRSARLTQAGSHAPVPSPGGGSVGLVSSAIDASTTASVIRLAPGLDSGLLALEVVHRMGPAGIVMLAPSSARAVQLAHRLRRSGVPVALLPDDWQQAADGRSVVVGTRAAAWAPVSTLRAAVILDAHDEAYREERSPTWSAVDVILERARRDACPALLVSACPTVSLLEGATLVTTGRDTELRGWPNVEVIDRTSDDPRTGLFSERLAELLRGELDRPDGRAVCILNRTGRAKLLACAHCGALARCSVCGGSMRQAVSAGALHCSRCEETRPPICAACDSSRLKLIRIGVARATEELSALTGVDAVEVSGRAPDAIPEGARLIVGTEAALHRVATAGTVAFLDFDQHVLAPRFAAAEEALALLARAARLVGVRAGRGRLVVQTRLPGHAALRSATKGDPSLLAQSEQMVRRELDLPPYAALALLQGPSAGGYAEELGRREGITVSAPEPDRRLVRARDHQLLCDAMAAVPRPAGRLRVAIDPTDV